MRRHPAAAPAATTAPAKPAATTAALQRGPRGPGRPRGHQARRRGTRHRGQVAKFASVADPDHPQHKSFEFFANRVKELTNGKLTVQIFPNSQLGNEREYIEQLQIGQIEFAKTSSAVLGPFVPQFQVFDLPYVFKSRAHLFKGTDGEVGKTLIKLAEDKLSIRGFGFFDAGTRGHVQLQAPHHHPGRHRRA